MLASASAIPPMKKLSTDEVVMSAAIGGTMLASASAIPPMKKLSTDEVVVSAAIPLLLDLDCDFSSW